MLLMMVLVRMVFLRVWWHGPRGRVVVGDMLNGHAEGGTDENHYQQQSKS